jgi:hypothetical protein
MFLLQDCWWSGENVTSSCYRDTSFRKGSELFFQLRYYFDRYVFLCLNELPFRGLMNTGADCGSSFSAILRWGWGGLVFVCGARFEITGGRVWLAGEKNNMSILYHGWDRTRLQLFVTQVNVTAPLSTSNQTTKLQTKDGWFSCLRPMLLRDITTRIPIESNMDS